jgi:hypothetical protein
MADWLAIINQIRHSHLFQISSYKTLDELILAVSAFGLEMALISQNRISPPNLKLWSYIPESSLPLLSCLDLMLP